MSWVEHHCREQALRTATAVADARRDGLLPWDEVPEADSLFGAPAGLLQALQMRWHNRLAGTVDAVLADEPVDLERAVVNAWCHAAADMPGLRAILDANARHPALRQGRRKDQLLLAAASGRAGFGDVGAANAGATIEKRARGVAAETSLRGAA